VTMQPPARGRRAASALVGLALLAMAVMALRLVERGEAWLDRAWWLVGLAGLGGFCGGLVVLIGQPLMPRFRRTVWRLVAVGMLFTMGLMLAMMTGFIAYTLVIDGQFEAAPERYYRAFAFSAMQTAALFLISIPTYLLPWPLPLLTGTATYLLASPQSRLSPPKPVEPTKVG
jgi:hypothetical protein